VAENQGAGWALSDRTKDLKFVSLVTGETTEHLLEHDPKAFHLLTWMALRARRHKGIDDGMELGSCILSAPKLGMTRCEYREAQNRLKRYGLATFKTTNKNTIGTLLNSMIYDLGISLDSQQTANKEPTKSQQRANKEPVTEIEIKTETQKGRARGARVISDLGAAWEEMVKGDERFEAIRGEEWKKRWMVWASDRANRRVPLPMTPDGMRLDALNMLKVLRAGGTIEVVWGWMADAIQSQWRGWFFARKFEEWRNSLAPRVGASRQYRLGDAAAD